MAILKPGPGAIVASAGAIVASVSTLCAALLAAGCDPSDPELGDQPYRCGTEEPKCPQGYVCVERFDREQYCYREDSATRDGGITSPDAAPFTCADDSSTEPNEEIDSAQPVLMVESGRLFDIAGLAICPTSDVDVIRFDGISVTVDLRFLASRGALLLDIVDDTGDLLSDSVIVDGDLGHLRAQVPSTRSITGYARVRAATSGIRNNYTIRFKSGLLSAGENLGQNPGRTARW